MTFADDICKHLSQEDNTTEDLEHELNLLLSDDMACEISNRPQYSNSMLPTTDVSREQVQLVSPQVPRQDKNISAPKASERDESISETNEQMLTKKLQARSETMLVLKCVKLRNEMSLLYGL